MHRPDPSGTRPEGPDTWYEDSYFDFDTITKGANPQLAQGIDQILQAGEKLLPLVAEWLNTELQKRTDFTFPGEKTAIMEVDEAQIAEAIQAPRNIHIDSQGRISVVVVHSDPTYQAKNDPHIQIDGEWKPFIKGLGIALKRRVRDPKQEYLHRPIHAPLSLYYQGKDLTLQNIATLQPDQRETLTRYGKALSEAYSINSLSETLPTHINRSREAIQGLIGEL